MGYDLEKDDDDFPDKKIAIEVTGPEAAYITALCCPGCMCVAEDKL